MTELTKTVCIDPDNPKSPFEFEMIAASQHATQHLLEGYQLCMDCGLNQSLAKSQGVLWATTQLLAHHLMQHLANQMAPVDSIDREMVNIEKNIRGIFEKEYQGILDASLMAYAAEQGKPS